MNSFTFKLVSLFLCCTIGAAVPGYGQQTITPPSPEAAAMIRNINIPVSLYTGTASIAIPFFTISTQSVTVPVTLTYQASGIKVKDMETWVGLGWRLSTGGRISRMVRGAQADEVGYSKLTSTPNGQEANNLNSWSTSKIDERNNSDFDSEPDLFYYEIPGKSGQFVVDYQGNVHLIPYQGIQIDWHRTSFGSTFTITDENGNRYYFKDIETTVSRDVDDHNDVKDWITSWNLSEIITNQNDTIHYYYTDANPIIDFTSTQMQIDQATYTAGSGWKIETQEIQEKQREVTNYPRYIQAIEWNSGKLEFLTNPSSKNRPPLLAEIKLYSTDQYLKSIILTYGEFTNGAYKLVAVDEKNDDITEHICHFEYNTPHQLPSRSSLDYDHWGYFNGNGSSNNKHIPTYEAFGQVIQGADRSPHWPQTMANMLTDIIYKGGGRKTFEYEANIALDDPITNKTITGGGVRIKKIIEKVDGKQNVTEYQYVKADGKSSGEIYSGKILYTSTDFNTQSFNQQQYAIYENSQNLIYDFNGVSIVYSEVKEIKPNGSYIVNHYTSFLNGNRDVAALLYFPNSYGPGEVKSFDFGDGVLFPKSSRMWQRGLLTEQHQYNTNHELVHSQVNHYNLSAPAKSKVRGYVGLASNLGSFVRPTIHHVLGVYEWISQPIFLDSTTVWKGNYNLPTSTTITYDTTYLTANKSIQDDAEGNSFLTETTYTFDYGLQTGFATPMQSALTMMQRRNIRTTPIETISYKNGKITGAELTLFRMSNMPDSAVIVDRKLSLKLKKPIEATTFTKSSINSSGDFTYDSRYEEVQMMDQYDNWGNLTCTHSLHGNYKSFIYGYNHSLLIAEVDNAQQGGQEDYVTSQNYTFTANSPSVITRSFNLNVDQEIDLELDLAVDSAVRIGIDCMVTLVLQNSTTGQSITYTPNLAYQSSPENWKLRFILSALSGNNTITLTINTPNQLGWNLTGYYTLLTLHHNDLRNKEVFHTSFEENGVGTKSALSKTGDYVLNGSFSIDLRNFIPGNYVMTYWESSDNGISWQLKQQTIEVTNSSTTYNINSAGKIIDELRIHPSDARMITYTHLPGVGITSQTDANGNTIYYEYDKLGRLAATRNNKRQLIKSYQYQ